jgi:hypothetical protein
MMDGDNGLAYWRLEWSSRMVNLACVEDIDGCMTLYDSFCYLRGGGGSPMTPHCSWAWTFLGVLGFGSGTPGAGALPFQR